MTTTCKNPECRQPAPPDRKGYCTACYWYRRRHHTDRPANLIHRHYTRTLNHILANNESHA